MTTKPIHRLTLKDRLSRLNFTQACKLLGDDGRLLIRSGGQYEIDLKEQVYFQGDLFRLNLHRAIVTITLMSSAREGLQWNCDQCETPCEHVGAALSLILEEKTALSLAKPPPERSAVESLSEEELIEQAIAKRKEKSQQERFRLHSTNHKQVWTDYTITSAASGKTYRVALRGQQRGESYCTCPDFRTNTLGTCKHIMYALRRVKTKFSVSALGRSYRHKKLCVYITSGKTQALRFGIPSRLDTQAEKIIGNIAERDIHDVADLVKRLTRLDQLGQPVTVYPDAEEFIQQCLYQNRMNSLVEEIRQAPERHPLRKQLLKQELLPYQLDGIAFAVGAGRSVLADDMGLGKTIQGIGVAELLAQQAGIQKVLIICPTSVKSQWGSEIEKFSDRSCQVVLGRAAERATQYDSEAFFTICNYEQVLRDSMAIGRTPWDLIILDEGQRIKNWETQTSNVVKRLKSTYALVLSGTPLENRLDDLFSIIQFVDDRRLCPAFRFFNRHRVVDEKGKVLGYKNLAQLRENLKPVLLRRTREEVLTQLPERIVDIVRISPTKEQALIHNANMQIVASVVRKPFISEMDLLRLRQALLMCRMSADSTYLCNKIEPSESSKLERLEELLQQIFSEQGRKVLLFSEWTTMLNLIEKILDKLKLNYVRLDGSVPQKKRQQIVNQFQTNPECEIFLTTNAGSTGLNLQAANTVINVDLPWNPAVLEQRIARAHRMGQKQPVQVFLLVTEETLEESLLGTLSAKKDLALAALDTESDVDEVALKSGTEELRNRLEILLGAKPEAAAEKTDHVEIANEKRQHARRDRVAAAGGELLGAAFQFLGELVTQDESAQAPSESVVSNLKMRLAECVEQDDQGRQRFTVMLPHKKSLDDLASTLAKLLVTQQQ